MAVHFDRISVSLLCSQPFHLVINDCSQSVEIIRNHSNNIITYEDKKAINILQHYWMGHPLLVCVMCLVLDKGSNVEH